MPNSQPAAAKDPTIEYNLTIKELPESERPRERLLHYGPSALSNAELLAIIFRTGTPDQNAVRLAQGLLVEHQGLAGLAQAPMSELLRHKGIGEVKAIELRAAFELGRRLLVTAPEARPQVKSQADAANLLLGEMGSLEQEQLRTILLDTKNHVLKIHTVYMGSLNTAVVRVGELFREAIRLNSAGLIVAHNHPSGDPTPSPEDVHVTRQIVEAGKLLDIDVLDHLVIGMSRWVSLKERGLGF
jgi:DNA repair protein RadC